MCEENNIDKRKVKFKNLIISDKYVQVAISDSVRNKVMNLISAKRKTG